MERDESLLTLPANDAEFRVIAQDEGLNRQNSAL
jgi:hypothetical protein